MPRKNKMTSQADTMFEVFSVSKKDTMKGLGPKDKKKQVALLDILGENSLELTGEEIPEEKKKMKYEKSGSKDWGKIRNDKVSELMTDPVDKWDAKHFFCYFKKIFNKKYPEANLSLREIPGLNLMKSLRDKFINEFNEKPLSPYLVKDYIDWFFANHTDRMIYEKGDFYPHNLLLKRVMKSFLGQYKSIKTIAIPVYEIQEISFENMENAFLASRISFLMDYGIVITLNWLIAKKKKSEIEARDIVVAILRDTMKEGESSVDRIVSATKRFSSYPVAYNKKELADIFSLVKLKATDVLFSETAIECI